MTPVFTTPEERKVASLTYKAIKKLERNPSLVPNVAHLDQPAVKELLIREVAAEYSAGQLGLDGIAPAVDIAAIVEQTVPLVIGQTISIPRITVVPTSDVRSWYEPFTLDLSALRFQPVPDVLWIQHLQTGERETIGLGEGYAREDRPEDYVVSGLIDFDDVSYDANAELLYDLATQTVQHFHSYLTDDQTHRVLQVHQREIARFIHAEMQPHFREDATEYVTKVNSGFTPLKDSSYSQTVPDMDFRVAPADKSNMARYLFGGFRRCLYPLQKFHSDTERVLAIILDREARKWFKPAAGQFQITYRLGPELHDYQPDFVAELDDQIVMLEPKARNQLDDAEVLAKRDAAIAWCKLATDHAASYDGGKPWRYVLIPHDDIRENISLDYLINHWSV